jgi:hypothetical protein
MTSTGYSARQWQIFCGPMMGVCSLRTPPTRLIAATCPLRTTTMRGMRIAFQDLISSVDLA